MAAASVRSRWLASAFVAVATLGASVVGPSVADATTTTTGVLEVCKKASGTGVSGTFTFTVSGVSGSISVPVGGCSNPITVPAGDVTVTESAREGFVVEAIAATPALDGVYVGPSDLSLSLGLQPTIPVQHPPVLDAIARIRAACEERGRIAGMHCLAASDVARFAAQGFGVITAGGDMLLLKNALAAALAEARGGR